MCGKHEFTDLSPAGATGGSNSAKSQQAKRTHFYFHKSDESSDSNHEDSGDFSWSGSGVPDPFRRLRRLASDGGSWLARLSGKPIYVSRHGESEYNVEDRIGGDSALSSRGELYAKALGRFFNTQDTSDMVIWTSSLQRTVQTAAYVNSAERCQIPTLNEIDSGKLDGLTYEEFADKYPEEFQGREEDKLRFRYPEGESYVDCCERLVPFLERFEDECRSGSTAPLLIVAHQAILRCIFGYLLDTDITEIPFIKIPQHTVMQIKWADSLDLDGHVTADSVNQDCVVEYVRMPIDHAQQGVVSSAIEA